MGWIQGRDLPRRKRGKAGQVTGIDITSGFNALAFPAKEHSALLAKKAEGSLTGDETLRLDDLEDLLRCLRREWSHQQSKTKGQQMKLKFWFRDAILDITVIREVSRDTPIETLRCELKAWRNELRDGWPADDCAYGFRAV